MEIVNHLRPENCFATVIYSSDFTKIRSAVSQLSREIMFYRFGLKIPMHASFSVF